MKNKNRIQLNDKLIHIIGPRRLQNVLMGHYLNQKTGVECVQFGDFAYAPLLDDNTGSPRPNLILWDCEGKNLGGCMVDLESFDKKILSRIYMAFFNTRKGLGIEEKAVTRGIRGFFYEDDPLDKFPKGLHMILNGELWISREIMTKCILEEREDNSVFRNGLAILTQREREILTMISKGAKNEEVAQKLCISPNTVKTHVYNIFKKINVPNRLQAALWASKNL